MELEQMRQLDAIARFGTISAAAKELHVSQPSISRSMAKLEAELGQQLFDRTRNRAQLNEAGEVAVEHARAILREERLLVDAMDTLSKRHRTITVGSIAPAPVWSLTERIVDRFPGTIFSPVRLAEADALRALLNRDVDLVITRTRVSLPTVRCIPIMEERLSAFIPIHHPLARLDVVSFGQLDGESFLVDASAGFWIDICREMMPHAQIILQQDRTVLQQLVRSAQLISFVTNAANYIIPEGERVVVPISDDESRATFYLCSRTDSPARVLDIVRCMEGQA